MSLVVIILRITHVFTKGRPGDGSAKTASLNTVNSCLKEHVYIYLMSSVYWKGGY